MIPLYIINCINALINTPINRHNEGAQQNIIINWEKYETKLETKDDGKTHNDQRLFKLAHWVIHWMIILT